MKQYGYYKSYNTKNPLDRFKSLFSFELHEEDVRNHMGLLIAQAVFLMLLALTFIGFEAYTMNLEASVQHIPAQALSRVKENDTKTIVERKKAVQKNSSTQNNQVLGTFDEEKEKEPEHNLRKESYIIAVTGDSIVETMGDGDALREALEEEYPYTQFVIFNYAKGARNVSQALADFHEPLEYKDRDYRSIDVLKPDVIIVGSSGYNLFDPHDTNKHWLEYTRLVQEAQTVTPYVYMLAEPAPRRSGFGLGAEGIVWEPSTAWIHTGNIMEQIENVILLSDPLGVPVIDAYTPSFDEDGQQGRRELIDPSDNIHLSEEGHEFMAKIIVDTIDFEDIR